MGCRSDHLNANDREAESKLVCELLLYVIDAGGIVVDGKLRKSIKEDAENYYGNVELLDDRTAALCHALRTMSVSLQNTLIYDGRNPKARRLADWWDRHREADARREAEEKKHS